MPRARKLQVFVSSTYADLVPERQAAVEAILMAGHIPAGMELFAAGDESQLQAIRRWIDESDAFLLILGGRYGSVDPASGKSYTHLEYEHAVARRMPLASVVVTEQHLEEKVRHEGSKVLETARANELKSFRADVQTRIVRFWSDPRDIKLAVLETLSEFERRQDVRGWVRSEDFVNVGALADEIARLSRENAELREALAASEQRSSTYNGLKYDELYRMLAAKELPPVNTSYRATLDGTATAFGDESPALLHGFWFISAYLAAKRSLPADGAAIATKLADLGLVNRLTDNPSQRMYELTDAGRRFLLRLRSVRDLSNAEKFRI